MVTTLKENSPTNERTCIVIDAGHGGIDGGATSCNGALESTINLEIAFKVNDLLHLLGIDTLMIRTTDESVHITGETIAAQKISDLKQRVKIVNQTKNAILISIHQNYFSDSRYNGAQVFYSTTMHSDILAKEMQANLNKTLITGTRRQATKADGIYLMQNINCIGILVECGFLSNPEEEARLRSDAYQKKISSVIASTISLYLCEGSIT